MTWVRVESDGLRKVIYYCDWEAAVEVVLMVVAIAEGLGRLDKNQ